MKAVSSSGCCTSRSSTWLRTMSAFAPSSGGSTSFRRSLRASIKTMIDCGTSEMSCWRPFAAWPTWWNSSGPRAAGGWADSVRAARRDLAARARRAARRQRRGGPHDPLVVVEVAEARGGLPVEQDRHLRMQLERGGGDRRGHRALHGSRDGLALRGARAQQENLPRLQDRADAHGDRALGHPLALREDAPVVLDGGEGEGLDPRPRGEARRRLVEADVAVPADAQHLQVDAPRARDPPLVLRAVRLEVAGHRPVRDVDARGCDVHVIEERLPHEAVEAPRMRRSQTEVLVQVEGGHPREIEAFLAVEADQLAIHPERRAPRREPQGDRRLLADAVGHDARGLPVEGRGVRGEDYEHSPERPGAAVTGARRSRSGPVERPVALHGHAMAVPPLREVVPHRVVLGAAVVPERHRVDLPPEAALELGGLDVLVEEREHRRALAAGELDDPGGEGPVDEEGLAPRDRVGAHDRMLGLRELPALVLHAVASAVDVLAPVDG